MSKNKKRAEPENPEWKPIISSLLTGEADSIARGRRPRNRTGKEERPAALGSPLASSMLSRMSDRLGG